MKIDITIVLLLPRFFFFGFCLLPLVKEERKSMQVVILVSFDESFLNGDPFLT